jgi:hypothetical protein
MEEDSLRKIYKSLSKMGVVKVENSICSHHVSVTTSKMMVGHFNPFKSTLQNETALKVDANEKSSITNKPSSGKNE